jgi:regulator of sirC expression with transglutaminase-like and TPR domain
LSGQRNDPGSASRTGILRTSREVTAAKSAGQRDAIDRFAMADRIVPFVPGEAREHLHRACILIQQKQLDAAISELDDDLRMFPDSPGFRALRGLCRARVAKSSDNTALELAASDLERAAKEESLQPLVQFALASLAVKRKEWGRAAAHVTWLIEHNYDGIPARKIRARCYAAQGDYERAISDLTAVLRHGGSRSTCREILELLPHIHHEKADGALAIAYLDQLVGLCPDNPDVCAYRALVLATTGLHDRAMADMNRIVALVPNEDWSYRMRACMWLMTKSDWDRALADMDRCIALEPRGSFDYAFRAVLHAKKRNYVRALVDLALCAQTFDQTKLQFSWDTDFCFDRFVVRCRFKWELKDKTANPAPEVHARESERKIVWLGTRSLLAGILSPSN